MTNQNEGTIFVSSAISANQTVTEYVANLFPTLSSSQVSEVVKAYSDTGFTDTFDQAVLIMGECKRPYKRPNVDVIVDIL